LVKRYVAHDVHQFLFSTRFFVFTKFIILNGSHIDAHRIYDLTVAHFLKCVLNFGLSAVKTRFFLFTKFSMLKYTGVQRSGEARGDCLVVSPYQIIVLSSGV